MKKIIKIIVTMSIAVSLIMFKIIFDKSQVVNKGDTKITQNENNMETIEFGGKQWFYQNHKSKKDNFLESPIKAGTKKTKKYVLEDFSTHIHNTGDYLKIINHKQSSVLSTKKYPFKMWVLVESSEPKEKKEIIQ